MNNYEVFSKSLCPPIKAWVKNLPILENNIQIESTALEQLFDISQLPFIFKHVAVMPDVHAGIGATVGSVIATKKAIIPAAVGVDIGCGMIAQQTNLKASDLPESLKAIRQEIENVVPTGSNTWANPSRLNELTWILLKNDYEDIIAKYPQVKKKDVMNQLGTLGGGNHFVEMCLDENQNVWIMLHSGSRGIGNRIGSFFTELAREDMRKFFINLPNKDLAYFVKDTEHFEDYWTSLTWSQNYAQRNRDLIMLNIFIRLNAKHEQLGIPKITASGFSAINCHHNYASLENHFGENVYVTRKGAVRAREGELGIIPGSMGAKSFIVKGKGNAESFHSCSHGAGRKMSRSKAKELFTVEDHEKATAGIECRKDQGVIDETPSAYKDIDLVMKSQEDLVEIVHTLKQVLCIKG